VVDFPHPDVRGDKKLLRKALAAWEGHAEAEQAKREADLRVDTQYRASVRNRRDNSTLAESPGLRCPKRHLRP